MFVGDLGEREQAASGASRQYDAFHVSCSLSSKKSWPAATAPWISCRLHTRIGIAAPRGDRFDGRARSAHGGDARDAIGHRVPANRFLIGEGVRPAGGGVDDQVERAGLQKIDGVRTAFVHLEHGLRRDSGGADRVGGAARGGDFEAQFVEALGERHGDRLVAIVHADEHAALVGQRRAGAQLRFGERFAEILADAHHFAGRAHLRTQRRIDARKFVERKHRRFHEDIAGPAARRWRP